MLNIWMVVVWLVGSKLPTPLIKPAGQTDSTIQSGCSFSMTSQGIVSGLGNPELQLMVTDDTTWALTPTLTHVRTPRLTRCVLICHLGVLMQSDVRHGYHGDNMIDPEQKDSTVRRRRALRESFSRQKRGCALARWYLQTEAQSPPLEPPQPDTTQPDVQQAFTGGGLRTLVQSQQCWCWEEIKTPSWLN